MPLSEGALQNHVRYVSSQMGNYLWRNNTGVLPNPETGRPVRYGLCNDSANLNKVLKSSDLIGLTKITITPDMVGHTVAIFTASEIKEEGWKFNPNNSREVAQKNFIDLVNNSGGRAAFIASVDDYIRLVKNES